MKHFIDNIFNKINKYFYGNKESCRLLEINIATQEVKFQVKMKLPILKCSINQAINELNLISHISSIEACYLGGHYGKMIRARWFDSGAQGRLNKTTSLLLIQNSYGRYQILYKNRVGQIGFYDRKLQKEFIESPLSMANNVDLISQFNSSQACYIGILAALQSVKKDCMQILVDKLNNQSGKKLYLSLVK